MSHGLLITKFEKQYIFFYLYVINEVNVQSSFFPLKQHIIPTTAATMSWCNNYTNVQLTSIPLKEHSVPIMAAIKTSALKVNPTNDFLQ